MAKWRVPAGGKMQPFGPWLPPPMARMVLLGICARAAQRVKAKLKAAEAEQERALEASNYIQQTVTNYIRVVPWPPFYSGGAKVTDTNIPNQKQGARNTLQCSTGTLLPLPNPRMLYRLRRFGWLNDDFFTAIRP